MSVDLTKQWAAADHTGCLHLGKGAKPSASALPQMRALITTLGFCTDVLVCVTNSIHPSLSGERVTDAREAFLILAVR